MADDDKPTAVHPRRDQARLAAAASLLLEALQIEDRVHQHGYTEMAAETLGGDFLDAYRRHGAWGLRHEMFMRRRAAIQAATGEER